MAWLNFDSWEAWTLTGSFKARCFKHRTKGIYFYIRILPAESSRIAKTEQPSHYQSSRRKVEISHFVLDNSKRPF